MPPSRSLTSCTAASAPSRTSGNDAGRVALEVDHTDHERLEAVVGRQWCVGGGLHRGLERRCALAVLGIDVALPGRLLRRVAAFGGRACLGGVAAFRGLGRVGRLGRLGTPGRGGRVCRLRFTCGCGATCAAVVVITARCGDQHDNGRHGSCS